MPVLPTREDLGRPVSTAPTGGIVRRDTTGTGRALTTLGSGISAMGATTSQAWDANERAAVEARFQKFQYDERNFLDAETRNLTPDTARGFAEVNYGEDGTYHNRAREFLDSVPDHLKQEFDSKLLELNQRHLEASRGTERQHSLLYAEQNINSALQEGFLPLMDRVGELDPLTAANEFDKAVSDFEAMVDALPDDLMPPAEKQRQKEIGKAALAASIGQALPPEQQMLLDPSQVSETVTRRIIQIESGGNPEAKNKTSSARGLGQFTRGTWVEYVRRFAGDRYGHLNDDQIFQMAGSAEHAALQIEMLSHLTRENTRHLESNGIAPTPGNVYLAHFLGPAGAVRMLKADPSAIASVVDPQAAKNNPTIFFSGKTPLTAGQIVQWAEGKMQGVVAVDWGRRLAPYLSLDDRLALSEDGRAAFVARQEAAAQQQRDQQNAYSDKIKADIALGSTEYGMFQLNQDRDSGRLRDDQIPSIEGAITKRDKDMLNAARAGEWLAGVAVSGQRVNSYDKDNQDRMDALAERDDLGGKFLNGDSDEYEWAVQTNKARARITGIIPKSMVNAMKTGINSSDQGVLLRSMAALDDMYNDPSLSAAVRQFFNDDDLKRLQTYRATRRFFGDDKVAEALGIGVTPEVQRIRDERRKAAEEEVADITPKDVVNAVFDNIFPFNEPMPPIMADDQQMLVDDYRDAYAYFKSLDMNPDLVHDEIFELLSSRWGKSEVGTGRARMMRHPPEAPGNYGPVDGSHDYIADQLENFMRGRVPQIFDDAAPAARALREPAGVPRAVPRDGAQYWLVATAETDAIVAHNRRNPGDYIPPRYAIAYIDENGSIAVIQARGPVGAGLASPGIPMGAGRDANRLGLFERISFDQPGAAEDVAREFIETGEEHDVEFLRRQAVGQELGTRLGTTQEDLATAREQLQ